MPTTKGDLEERLTLLRKVVELERAQGLQDRAAVGGLEAFVKAHLPQGASLVAGYSALAPAARAAALDRLEELLDSLEGKPTVEELQRPVEEIPGVGEKRASLLRKMGIDTVEDLLTYFPRRLEDRTARRKIADLADGETATVVGAVRAKSRVKVRPKLELVKAAVDDGTGLMFAVWFNQPWIWEELRQGEVYAFFGKAQRKFGTLQMENPVWEPAGADFHTGRWVPVYPVTEGLTQASLRWLIHKALRRYLPLVRDVLPEEVRRRMGLLPRREAIRRIHSPGGPRDFELARKTLAFEELFLLQVGLALQRKAEAQGRAIEPDPEMVSRFIASLPYRLTPSQRRAIQAIQDDLQAPYPMLRLLQGDVGSGKTVVAAAACVMTASAGAQAAFMAPTEILAQQHFFVLKELLSGLSARVELLVGGVGTKERERVLAGLAAGEVDVVVGTHALIQEDVEFHDLALAVIDEQHRFGVIQRAALEKKGRGTNILVMSATPIPRTVVLTLYGEFSVSVLEEMPVHRERVRTVWVSESRREEVYREVEGLLARGEKGYVILPLVEESGELDLRAATQAYEELKRRFPGVGIALLHGRMSAEEKGAAMAAFRAGEVRILVATTVVEVGLDVPDASFMVIEHADRFGLAQLHQLRGRIGRRGQEAVCYAIADPKTEEARKRLAAFRDLTDGFKIAEADLKIRGPGDLLGTAQHGFVSRLRAANLIRDVALLEQARAEARRLVEKGVPARLRREVDRRFGKELELLGV